jgi:hypothetical protein
MTIHPGDEELLDLALGDPDAQVERHIEDCAECRARFDAVRREGAFITRALGDADVPRRLTERILPRSALSGAWLPLAAAALLLGSTIWFAFSARRWKDEAGRLSSAKPAPAVEQRKADPGENRWKLRDAAQHVAGARMGGAAPEEAMGQFKGIVIEQTTDFVELSDDQRVRFEELITKTLERLMQGEDRAKLVAEYRRTLRSLLTPEQFSSMEAQAAEEAEWFRSDSIEMVIDELAAALDLRHSEGEALRGPLEKRYPAPDPLASFTMGMPSDPLLDDAVLAAAVREALKPEYRAKYDDHLKESARQREEMKKMMGPEK